MDGTRKTAWWLVPVLLVLAAVPGAHAQTSSSAVRVSVFSMETAAIQALVKDGLTDVEWQQLLNEALPAGNLLAEATATALAKETPSLPLVKEKLAELRQAGGTKSIVFIFTLSIGAEARESGGKVMRQGYALGAKGEKLLPREGSWTIPAGSYRYRLVDFRHAPVLRPPQFIYELTTQFGTMEEAYKIVIPNEG